MSLETLGVVAMLGTATPGGPGETEGDTPAGGGASQAKLKNGFRKVGPASALPPNAAAPSQCSRPVVRSATHNRAQPRTAVQNHTPPLTTAHYRTRRQRLSPLPPPRPPAPLQGYLAHKKQHYPQGPH